MESPGSSAEINEEIMNGVFGTNLKAMGFISFQCQPNVEYPDVDPEVVHFDLTRKAELMPQKTIKKILNDVTRLAESLGFQIVYTNTFIGKKDNFYKPDTTIKLGVKG